MDSSGVATMASSWCLVKETPASPLPSFPLHTWFAQELEWKREDKPINPSTFEVHRTENSAELFVKNKKYIKNPILLIFTFLYSCCFPERF